MDDGAALPPGSSLPGKWQGAVWPVEWCSRTRVWRLLGLMSLGLLHPGLCRAV